MYYISVLLLAIVTRVAQTFPLFDGFSSLTDNSDKAENPPGYTRAAINDFINNACDEDCQQQFHQDE